MDNKLSHEAEMPSASPPPKVMMVWLHLPTGAAGMQELWNHFGGPAAGKSERVLQPDRPEPFSEGPWSLHTTGDVEAALAELGLRIITRHEATRLLTLAGYQLGRKRSFGHALYADQADSVTWWDRNCAVYAFAA